MTQRFSLSPTMEREVLRNQQVRPVFVDEPEEIVVVTVYTYYF